MDINLPCALISIKKTKTLSINMAKINRKNLLNLLLNVEKEIESLDDVLVIRCDINVKNHY